MSASFPFGERLADLVRRRSSACVGLDPHLGRVPGAREGASREENAAAAEAFCRGVIEVVADQVAAVKPQVAFFEQLGAPGVAALARVVRAAKDAGLVVILDAKRGDIGSTAQAYVRATLADEGPMGADAVTLSPYLGPESLTPFVEQLPHGKGVFLLVRTSNPGAGPWQRDTGLAEDIAGWIAGQNAQAPTWGSVGAVVGATLPREAPHWRGLMPKAWWLVPGFGAQGATARDVRGHFASPGMGALITSSRGVLFGAAPRESVHHYKDAVHQRAAALVEALAALA